VIYIYTKDIYLIVLFGSTLTTADIGILEPNTSLRKGTGGTPLLNIVGKTILRLLSSTSTIRLIYIIRRPTFTLDESLRGNISYRLFY